MSGNKMEGSAYILGAAICSAFAGIVCSFISYFYLNWGLVLSFLTYLSVGLVVFLALSIQAVMGHLLGQDNENRINSGSGEVPAK